MKHSLSIPAQLLNSLFDGARSLDVELSTVFETAGIDYREFLDKLDDPAYRINLEHIGPLLRALWLTMNDEASGFLSTRLKVGTFAMMCHAISTSPNLKKALRRSAKFISLISDDIQIELHEKDGETELEINFVNAKNLDEVFFVTSLFVIWIRLSCWLIKKQLLLNRIEFTFDRPSYEEEFNQMFPCRHSFSCARNVVAFDSKHLQQKICQDEASFANFLRNAPESLLTQYRSDDSVTAQVKRSLTVIKNGVFELENKSFEVIATELNSTTHTLRRRLKEEGHSFQELKDNIRKEQALTLLNDDSLSMIDVAITLGFSEPAAFNRAFKKWTGKTPGQFKGEL